MARYRKRPLEVEAVRFTGANHRKVLDWCRRHGHPEASRGIGPAGPEPADVIRVPTREGVMTASPGD